MEGHGVIIEVPGIISYRDLVLRTVSAAAKVAVVHAGLRGEAAGMLSAHVVSAVGEVFNSIALHGYRGEPGMVRIEIEVEDDRIALKIQDFGRSFDAALLDTPVAEQELTRTGLGVFITKAFMDEVRYSPGRPNTMTMAKKFCSG